MSVATMADPMQHDGHRNRFMQFFDTNGDNVVTMDEFKDAAVNRFNNMDADNNGVVTVKEFQSYISAKRKERRAEYFNNVDANKDGSISQQEYIQYQQKKAEMQFQSMDTNKDGMLSSEEFTSHRKNWRGHGPRHDYKGENSMFSRIDTNNDGNITQDESLAAWSRWFSRIDANGDKSVTIDEIRNFRDNNAHSWK